MLPFKFLIICSLFSYSFAELMRAIYSILFVAILAVSVFGQGIIVMRYFANKTFISKELCVNRTRPMLNCNGKCVLGKKLQQKQKQEERAGVEISSKFETISRTGSLVILPKPLEVLLKVDHLFYAPNQICTGLPRSVFHPPNFC